MKRYIFLYSPAVVVAACAIVYSTIGRTDASVVIGCVFLAITLVFHTYQVIEDFHRRNGKSRERHS